MLCRAHAHLGEWGEAEGRCRASVELNPAYEEGWVGLGRSMLEQGPTRWADAERTMREFLVESGPPPGEAPPPGSMVAIAAELLRDVSSRQRGREF
jgi:hypothetical protein